MSNQGAERGGERDSTGAGVAQSQFTRRVLVCERRETSNSRHSSASSKQVKCEKKDEGSLCDREREMSALPSPAENTRSTSHRYQCQIWAQIRPTSARLDRRGATTVKLIMGCFKALFASKPGPLEISRKGGTGSCV